MAVLVLLELFLRGLGLLLSLQTLHIENISRNSEKSEYIILCIGDSWTAGQPSGNYPDELQKALNTINVNRQFRVINLGFGGSNSSQGIQVLIKNLSKYHPDMVIAMIGNNDHWNLSESTYWKFVNEEMSAGRILKAKARVFLHSLRVYKFSKILYYKLRGLPTPNQFYDGAPEDQLSSFAETSAIDSETHKKQLEYNLIKLIEFAQINDFTLIFQTYFHFHGYSVNEIIRDVTITYHVPLVDNNILFHQKIPVEDREKYLVPDGHPNPEGYRFIAENVLVVLRKEMNL